MASPVSSKSSNDGVSPTSPVGPDNTLRNNPSYNDSVFDDDFKIHDSNVHNSDTSNQHKASEGAPTFNEKGATAHVEKLPSSCSNSDMNDDDAANDDLFGRLRRHLKQRDGNTWRTTFIRDGPLIGIAALLFVLLSIPAAAIVLAVSDGQAVERWKVQPSVYLSVFTGIGNKALAFAAAEGAIVTWWVRAVRGTTLKNLHYDWAAGNHVLGSFSIKRAGILTATSLCAMVILVDGILLQSATTTVQQSLSLPVRLNVNLPREIPTNFTGIGAKLDPENEWIQTTFKADFAEVWKDWGNRSPIPSPIEGCPGTCNTAVRAPALKLNHCRVTETAFMNLTAIAAANGSESSYPSICKNQDGEGRWCPALSVSVAISAEAISREQVLVSIGIIDPEMGEKNEGNFTRRTCYLDPAVAEYSVAVHDSERVVVNTTNPTILSLANNTARQPSAPYEYINSTLGGIAVLADMSYHSNVLMRIRKDAAWLNSPGPFQQSLIENPTFFSDMSQQNPPILRDPSQEIFAGLNELMFRAAVLAANKVNQSDLGALLDPGLPSRYGVDGTRIDAQPVFHTRWSFFCGAAAVQILCVALVTVTYWKYWTIGRTASLSPLEIAKAFDAPLLRDAKPNLRARHLAEAVGDRRVRYGLVKSNEKEEGPSSMRLLFDEEDGVESPWDGCRISA